MKLRLKICPAAKIDDGKTDVIIVRPAPRWQLLKFFRGVFSGAHLSLPFVSYHQVRTLKIELTDEDTLG